MKNSANHSTNSTQANVIRTIRAARKLSLRAFAAELGVSHNAVALVERGTNRFGSDRIEIWSISGVEWIRAMARALAVARRAEAYSPTRTAARTAWTRKLSEARAKYQEEHE